MIVRGDTVSARSLTNLSRGAWVSLALAAGAACGGDDCLTVGDGLVCGATRAELPVLHDRGWPVVEGHLNGVPVRLLVDTGAGAHVVSSSLLGVEDNRWVRIDELCLADLCLREVLVWALDTALTSATQAPDRVQGIIGTPLLANASLELRQGTWLAVDVAGGGCRGEEIDLGTDAFQRPTVDVRVDARSLGEWVIDTGSLYTLLDETTVEALASEVVDPRPATLCTIHGCGEGAHTGRIGRMCLSTLCTDDVPVKYPGAAAVGATFFAAGRFVLDLRRSSLTRCAEP